MKLHFTNAVLVFALATAVAGANAATKGQTLEGTVVNVADGDTVTLLLPDRTRHRIRLAEIDAPETGQPFGRQSKNSVIRMCAQRNASVYVNDVDRYGRLIGRVICDGVDTSAEQVRTGMAWVYDSYVSDKSLYELQEDAKTSRVGLWFDLSPIPPWEWRKGSRGNSSQGVASKERLAPIYGNPRSNIYHIKGSCVGYNSLNPQHAIPFSTAAEAEAAGYRKAANCK